MFDSAAFDAAWSTACPDWAERLLDGRSLIPDLPLFDAEADKALRIFKRLRVPDLPDNPTYGEVCRPWVFDLVRAIFGSFDPETKRRLIREFFLLVPKKNGKSAIAAAIIVTAAIMNRRPEAELLLIAPTKLVAEIAYKQAAGIIRLDPELKKLFQVQAHIKTIRHQLTLATIVIKAADTDVITGGKATFTLIDETHVFAAKPKAAEVFVELRGALASRPDGFLLQITTQSKAPPAGVFKAELANARDVRDGKLTLPLLAVLYELPEAIAKDWRAPSNWGLVNPNLGASVDPRFLADELTKAEREGASALALFASQHFNVEIGLALRSDRWSGADHWLAAVDADLTLEALVERCEVIVLGGDGGGLDDLLGLCVLGREKGTRRWLAWFRAWCFRGVLELRKSEAPRLLDLEAAGQLTICDSVGQDIEEFCNIVAIVDQSGKLAMVGLDPVGVGSLVEALIDIEVYPNDVPEEGQVKRIYAVSQGWKLTGAIKTTARKLADGTLQHADQDLMNWCVGNAKVEPRGNAIVITKQAAGTAKIDPLMALFNAVALMSENPEAPGSVYTPERGLIILDA